MLIHVDMVEDWMPPSPRSSHSAQSGLPSSGSDDDDTPFPVVAPASWTMDVEDGQRNDRLHRLARAPVASMGCRGEPRGGRSRDRDDEGGPGAGGRRSSKDVLLRRGDSRAPPRAAPPQRRRSLSPPARRGSRESSGRRSGAGRATASARCQSRPRQTIPTPSGAARDTGSDTAATQPAPVARSSISGKDPVEDFFRTAKKPTIASVIVDGLAADVHIAAEAAVAASLEFDEAPLVKVSCEAVQLDAFSPTLSATVSELGQFQRATPSPANTMEVQLGAPLIGTTPARRPAAPPKTRATSTPTRSSARQAAIGSSVPVAQRASLRLVKELGLLGPRDKMTDDVARALLHRFDEPLSHSDISVIARLTRLDSEALRVMAHMTGPDGAANEATV
ncbi:hypothetical protein D1007_04318 [Hordeum vulgare]|nr:hypothetical protein D1007_04318 [Hordeum vulgare]